MYFPLFSPTTLSFVFLFCFLFLKYFWICFLSSSSDSFFSASF
jgi:hypothetical protein